MAYETGIAISIDSRPAVAGGRQVVETFDKVKASARGSFDLVNKVSTDAFSRTQRAAEGFATRTVGAFNRVKAAALSLRTGIIGIAVTLAGGFLLRTTARFEDLRDSLVAVTGSVEAANKSFAFIQRVAATMPVDIETVTKSFITLKAAGLEPTMEQFRLFSDVASVTTNSLDTFNTMVRIFSRGIQGSLQLEDLNQIADRGIPIWDILQKKIGVTRLELSQLGSTTEGAVRIMNALNEGLDETFGGATARKLDNLSTKWSNFKDALAITTDKFSQLYHVSDLAGGALSLTTDLIEALGDAYVWVGRVSTFVWAQMGIAIDNVRSGSLSALKTQVLNVTDAFDKFMEQRRSLDRIAPTGTSGGGSKGLVITQPGYPSGATKNQLELLDQLNVLRDRNEAIAHGNVALAQFDKMIASSKDVAAFEKSAQAAGFYGDRLNTLVDQYRLARDEADRLTESSARFNEVASGVSDALGTAFEDAVVNGNSFLDVLHNLENQMLKIGNEQFINKPLNDLFSSFAGGGGGGGGGLSGMFGSLFGSGGGSNVLSSGALDTFFQAYHGGGIVGEGGSPRRVDPRVFAHAPRMHSGGMVPGEVPIIAKKGERVLTKDQQKNMGRPVSVTLNVTGVADAGSFVKNEGKVLAAASRALALANARNN